MCASSLGGERAADSSDIPRVDFADSRVSDKLAHIVVANSAAGHDGNSIASLSNESCDY